MVQNVLPKCPKIAFLSFLKAKIFPEEHAPWTRLLCSGWNIINSKLFEKVHSNNKQHLVYQRKIQITMASTRKYLKIKYFYFQFKLK